MKLKTLTTLALFFLFITGVNAQSKSQIKDQNIKSTTIIEYDYSTGKETQKKVSFEKFNAQGLVVEYIDYDKNGKQKEKIVYSYNESGKLIEEAYYSSNNKLDKLYKYTYNNGLKQSKEKYDNNKKLVWKKVYEYEM